MCAARLRACSHTSEECKYNSGDHHNIDTMIINETSKNKATMELLPRLIQIFLWLNNGLHLLVLFPQPHRSASLTVDLFALVSHCTELGSIT